MGQAPDNEVTIADASWLGAPDVRALFAALNREGFEVRAVGGAVRNTLLGLPVGEVDFATTAPPAEIIRLAEAAGLKTVPTGLDHGTVTLVCDGSAFEVTTLRSDIETDGRHAIVAFTNDWKADAARRDFTLNALYADASGKVHDPIGGLADLRARHVRFIGNPRDRIREDYLRILRFFRFSAAYGEGRVDDEGLAACIAERQGLRRLSRERVRAELLKLLVAPDVAPVIEVMEDCGIIQMLLAGVTRRMRLGRLIDLEKRLNVPPNAIRRLAALALFVREDAERLAERLRLSKAEAADLASLAEWRSLHGGLSDAETGARLYRLGIRDFRNRLLIAWADSGDGPDQEDWRRLWARADEWPHPRFPVSGADLVVRGIAPGPKLGAVLRRLEDAWIESGFRLGKDELLALLDEGGSG